MSRFDRYLFGEFLRVFGFFSLILVLVYWVNRAVGLFDRLIADGQSALVFLEFSLLTIPGVVRIVLPVAAFAAAVYVTNRLSQDGELTVVQATGFSAFRLARPVAVFGLVATGLMLVLTNVIVPASRAQLAERQSEIEANVTAGLLQDGRFMHPSDGLTFYIREITDTGELRDIFLADDRAEGSRTTYTARRALLVRDGPGAKLLMFEGQSQTLARDSARLTITHFSDFTYDLGELLGRGARDAVGVQELATRDLLFPRAALLALTGETPEVFLTEAHGRIAGPFLALAAALLGFSALLVGGFSRFGLWKQMLLGIVLIILVQMLNNAATGASLRQPGLWALAYVAPAVGVAMALAILAFTQRPRRLRPAAGGAA